MNQLNFINRTKWPDIHQASLRISLFDWRLKGKEATYKEEVFRNILYKTFPLVFLLRIRAGSACLPQDFLYRLGSDLGSTRRLLYRSNTILTYPIMRYDVGSRTPFFLRSFLALVLKKDRKEVSKTDFADVHNKSPPHGIWETA